MDPAQPGVQQPIAARHKPHGKPECALPGASNKKARQLAGFENIV
jgi:hypothetical protein